jgi:predicted dehydrogenase
VPNLQLVGVADLDGARAAALAGEFGIGWHGTDWEAMVRELRPAVVHVVTQPAFRVEPVRRCAALGVQAVIVEKPLAVSLAEAEELARIAAASGLKVIVNTQRRYFASWVGACAAVARELGPVRQVHVHTNAALGCIGGHVIDMVQRLLGDVAPEAIWATAAGAEDWHTNHPGPAHVLASLTYPDRVRVTLEMSKSGVGVPGCGDFWFSTGLEVQAEHGFLWWTEDRGWGWQAHGSATVHRAPTSFAADDAAGQGAFTEAVGRWLSDPATPHGNRLETALRVFRITTAIEAAAALGTRLAYDETALVDRRPELRALLEQREGVHPERVDWRSCPDTAWRRPAVRISGGTE